MDGQETFKFAVGKIVEDIKLVTQKAGLTLDEVDYVVVLSYDFKEYEDGFYLSETVPLQEYATIYIYSVRDSANIWTSSVIEGPPPGSFSYANEPPEYHSGGSPDVEATFIEAMEFIMK